jgi:hypothetical protein
MDNLHIESYIYVYYNENGLLISQSATLSLSLTAIQPSFLAYEIYSGRIFPYNGKPIKEEGIKRNNNNNDIM